jgi:hypothetical protein
VYDCWIGVAKQEGGSEMRPQASEKVPFFVRQSIDFHILKIYKVTPFGAEHVHFFNYDAFHSN